MSMRHGWGVEIWPNGNRYEGDYDKDRMHGKGKMVTGAGTYEGAYKDGFKHGTGVMLFKNGQVSSTSCRQHFLLHSLRSPVNLLGFRYHS